MELHQKAGLNILGHLALTSDYGLMVHGDATPSLFRAVCVLCQTQNPDLANEGTKVGGADLTH
jgi:hypothetical protein